MKSTDQENINILRQLNNHSLVQLEHQQITPQKLHSTQPINKSEDDDEACGHDHGHKHGQHGHTHGSKNRHQRIPGQKNYVIITYTVFTCLSCWYLQTQYLNPLIGDLKSQIMTALTYFDVVMCLWSYFQTFRIDSHVQKIKDIFHKPYDIQLRHCDKCNHWKAPRVSHCSSCGKCIYKLDHHCMWTQTCIGYCNQRPFYLFCIYMALGVFQFWYSTLRVTSVLTQNCHFFGAFELGIYVLWGVTCVSAGIVGMMIVGLAFGHTFMITTNFTTLDGMKTKRSCPIPFLEFRKTQIQPKNTNIWDRGQIQNLKSIFGNNILTCWLPLGRQIQNQFKFQPTHPEHISSPQVIAPIVPQLGDVIV